MVYWVHVMLVYGIISMPIKRTMTAWQAAISTVLLVLLMVWLSARWMAWKQRHAMQASLDAANAQTPAEWKPPSLLRRVWGSARP
jgi:predicted ABC-type exoprotein transport system permease subunit